MSSADSTGIRLANFDSADPISDTDFFYGLQASGTREVKVLAQQILDYIAAGNGGLITTTGAPSNAVGRNGQIALDFATAIAYGPKTNGAWPSGVQLQYPSSIAQPSGNAYALVPGPNEVQLTGGNGSPAGLILSPVPGGSSGLPASFEIINADYNSPAIVKSSGPLTYFRSPDATDYATVGNFAIPVDCTIGALIRVKASDLAGYSGNINVLTANVANLFEFGMSGANAQNPNAIRLGLVNSSGTLGAGYFGGANAPVGKGYADQWILIAARRTSTSRPSETTALGAFAESADTWSISWCPIPTVLPQDGTGVYVAHGVIASQPADGSFPLASASYKVGGNAAKTMDVRNLFLCNQYLTAYQLAQIAYGVSLTELGLTLVASDTYLNLSSPFDLTDMVNGDQNLSLTGSPLYLGDGPSIAGYLGSVTANARLKGSCNDGVIRVNP